MSRGRAIPMNEMNESFINMKSETNVPTARYVTSGRLAGGQPVRYTRCAGLETKLLQVWRMR
jgi:hypothetical protein